MPRDVELIIESLTAELPGVTITQLQPTHPGDDDGVWLIAIPIRSKTVQIESSSGNCAFLIESDFNNERFQGNSVQEVLSTVRRLYS
jgi:hypothetical protein